MSKDPMQWLTGDRRLTADLLSAMGVRVVEHPQLGAAVSFPYRRGGETYAGKFRRPYPKDWRSTQGVSRGVFNEDNLRAFEGLPVVITEGEIDCLSVIQAGFDRAISLPDGWTQEGNKLDPLIAVEAELRAAPFVVVAGDNDETGESLPRKVATLLKGCDVRTAAWPDGCKDANDVLVQHGEGALAGCLNAAKPIDPPGGFITGISDLPPLSERRVLRTGLQPFDRICAFELGAMSVWTGVPGSGKSTFLTWAAERVSLNEGARVGIMAFETHPYELRDHLSLIRSGRPFDALDGDTRARFLSSVDKRFRVVHRTFEEVAHRIGWLEEMIYSLAVRDGCKLIVVDPWNELEHLPEPGESMTNYINWALQRIRQIAENLEVHIALVAHPKKMGETYKTPTGYDIADSAAFFNKPSLGVTVHQREDDAGEPYVELSVWKVRNRRLYGFYKGRTKVSFDMTTQTYGPFQAASEAVQ